jgi:hypothetical protein
MTRIKKINEQFAQTLTGDSFNSSNGVFKVNYKPFSDLSISVGRDPDPSNLIKDYQYQIGDFVKGSVEGKKNKIEGEIVSVSKEKDNKFSILKIKSFNDKKIHTLIPGSVELITDRGNSREILANNVTSQERGAKNLKYTGGNVIWGSLENDNETIDGLNGNIEKEFINGPMGTGWKIIFTDNLPTENTLLNQFIIDPETNTIYSLRKDEIDELTDEIKAIEAYSYMLHHNDLKDKETALKSILSIMFLELKKELLAKKNLIKNFPKINNISYGEAKDLHWNDAKSIINSFL